MNHNTKYRKYLTFILLAFAMLAVSPSIAQKRVKTEKQKEQFEDLQEERKEKEAKAREEDLKKHLEKQSKNTQKMMKKSRKKSKRIAKNKHQDNFFRRLFTKKK